MSLVTYQQILIFQQKPILEDPLLESAASLEKKYESVKMGKAELEAKVNKAKHLREKLKQLKSGKNYLKLKDINQLDQDVKIKKSILHDSSEAEFEIVLLEEQIAKIKSVGKFVSPSCKVKIENRIESMQKSIANATKVQQMIFKVKTESGFCSESKTEELQTKLDTVQNVLKKLQPSNPGKA